MAQVTFDIDRDSEKAVYAQIASAIRETIAIGLAVALAIWAIAST